MEFTKQQSNQLKQLKDMDKFRKLQANCEEFKGDFERLITERSECLSKREILMERLPSLQEDLKIARNQELLWQQKLEEVSKSGVDYENDNLQNLCLLLGYQISKYQQLESNGVQVTLHYRDACYVTYSEIDHAFDVIEIFPAYFDFAKVQRFLQNSQDLRGLLACLRKFFDLALELKANQEKTNL